MSAEGIVNCGEHTSCNRNMPFVVFARIVWQELNLRMKNKTQNHVANHNNDTLTHTPPPSLAQRGRSCWFLLGAFIK